jgi:hypothetical protein
MKYNKGPQTWMNSGAQLLLGNQIKEDEMNRSCCTHRDEKCMKKFSQET